MTPSRDHGGGLDAAIAHYGGTRGDWLDLSTGINPRPYPVRDLPADAWTALPDSGAQTRLLAAARHFWRVPDDFAILAAPGLSAVIAQLPFVLGAPRACRIAPPTYNEWAASFGNAGWQVVEAGESAPVHVHVHPNNPDGRYCNPAENGASLKIFDESFCDITPERSVLRGIMPCRALDPGKVLVTKSFGKFWGCAGLRLGFLIGPEAVLARMADRLGPWPVSGPALEIGAKALSDPDWAAATRARLTLDARRLDGLMQARGLQRPRGTTLFRLYEAADAAELQRHLARHRIWTRIFPYSKTWIRLGLPGTDRDWTRLATALEAA